MLIIVFFAYVSFIKCIALEVQFNISFLIKKTVFKLNFVVSGNEESSIFRYLPGRNFRGH